MSRGNIDLGVNIRGAKSAGKNEECDGNPYSSPDSYLESNPFTGFTHEKVRLGFWGVFVAVIHILNSICLAFIAYYILVVKGNTNWVYCMFPPLAIIEFFSYVFLLLRNNLARKIVLVISYCQLLFIPVGTIMGMIMISKIKGKNF